MPAGILHGIICGAIETPCVPISTTQFIDSICPGNSLFVGGAWQTTPRTYVDTAMTKSGCDSLLVTTIFNRNAPECAVDTTVETILYLVSDSGWTLSTEVTIATSNSFPWPGVATYVPHDSTFTLPVEVGQPYPWTHLYTVMGSEVITARSGVTYYRYEFELTEHQALNARFRMFVDDDMQIFINRHEVALEDDMGKMNWRTANHDILFNDNGLVDNGYNGGDPFDTYTAENLDSVFKTAGNDIILAIRNRTSKPDIGGFSFRMDLDKAGKGVIVKKDADAFDTYEQEGGFAAYPNPTSGFVTIEITDALLIGGQISVYDFSGKLLQQHTVSEHGEINLESYSSGMYMLQITAGEQSFVRKIFKN